MKRIAAVFVLACIIILSINCGDSATDISGTLPVITDITVDSLASTGDTVYVNWTALTSVPIQGYYLWTRNTFDAPWLLVNTYEENTGMHIANQSAYYTVMAFNGNNTSSEPGASDNTRTDNLSEIRERFSMEPIGFRIDIEGDSLVAGDPSSPAFAQHFIVAIDTLALDRFIYSGNANPRLWPGGADTRVSSRGSFVAPAPDDSIHWNDRISYGGHFFLEMDNGYYCLLQSLQTLPDTVTMSDTLIIDGQIQPIEGLRLFVSYP